MADIPVEQNQFTINLAGTICIAISTWIQTNYGLRCCQAGTSGGCYHDLRSQYILQKEANSGGSCPHFGRSAPTSTKWQLSKEGGTRCQARNTASGKLLLLVRHCIIHQIII